MRYIIALFLLSVASLSANENITVIGIGRLGLCTALAFEEAGYCVTGVDINHDYVAALNDKSFSTLEPGVDGLLRKSTRFKATCSLDEGIEASDIIYIIVDTPTTTEKEAYDHSKLTKILVEINKRKVHNKHVVIGCTVFPGYIRKTGNDLLKDCVNTTLSYNPEFIAQGNILYGFRNPDIILIGEGNSEAGDRLVSIYEKVCVNQPKINRMSPDSAEITKLAINCYVTTKVAYANMIGDIADQTPGADKYAILQAVGGDKRVGSLYLKPGYGFGGPCFPRDNRALGTYAKQVGVEPIIPEASDNSNKFHAQWMIQQFLKESRSEYVFTEVAYKENCPVPIIEESQKLVVAAGLAAHGKRVVIIDTSIIINEVQKAFGDIFEYHVIENAQIMKG